jgi:hypothetical protein
MPRIVREADVSWEGNLARGAGALTAASSGAFEALGYLNTLLIFLLTLQVKCAMLLPYCEYSISRRS